MPEDRKCKSCEAVKPIEDFPHFSSANAGRKSICKSCNQSLVKLRGELRKTAPPQPEVCECCGCKPEKSLVLDHDHKTNEFRGWLCQSCNIGIGRLGDDEAGLENAIRYLRSR